VARRPSIRDGGSHGRAGRHLRPHRTAGVHAARDPDDATPDRAADDGEADATPDRAADDSQADATPDRAADDRRRLPLLTRWITAAARVRLRPGRLS
jgi:hypothetical protein